MHDTDDSGLRTGPHMTPPTEVRVGDELRGYRVDKLIGQGGMGVVYEAYDLRLNRTVALKLIAPELTRDDRFRERFARETQLAIALEHPNVVPIHDAGDVGGRLYLAMRLVPGADLRRLLRAEGALEPSRALSICGQVAAALDAAHARGLVHRDVKPSNILLDHDEHVYLADFGLTRRLDEQGSTAGKGRSIGTPSYIAPEQIDEEQVDGRADVYSLGCVLFECLTGAPPYVRGSRLAVAWAHVADEPPRASEVNPALPGAIDTVLRTALAKEPEERYQRCAELVDAARSALGLHAPRAARRRRTLAAGALAATLAVGAGAVLLLRGGGSTAPSVVANSLVKIDARTNRVVDVIPVGRTPDEIQVAGRYVFAASQGDGTLTRVDRRTGDVVTSGQYDATDGLAAEGGRRVWVGSIGRRAVIGVDPSLPEESPSSGPPPRVPLPRGTVGASLAVGGGSLWVARYWPQGAGALERWSLATLRRQRTYPLGPLEFGLDVAYGGGAAWVALGKPANAVLRVDARTGRARRIAAPDFPVGVETGFGSVWVPEWYGHAVRRIDAASGRTQTIIRVGEKPSAVARGRGSLWVPNHCDGTVARIDPRTNTVVATIKLGFYPQWLDADDDYIWVGVAGRPYVEPCTAPQTD